VAAIQEHVTAVLRSIPKEAFAEFPEAVWTLPTVCCEGWRLFWRPIKLICIFCFVRFLVPFIELFRRTTYKLHEAGESPRKKHNNRVGCVKTSKVRCILYKRNISWQIFIDVNTKFHPNP
jgi:hypothetical protein